MEGKLLIKQFLDHFGELYLNDELSDVKFIIENQRIPVHRQILAARSKYFKAMFFGDLKESNESEIKLMVPLNAFKPLLKYLYTGCINLVDLDFQGIIDIYSLAHEYNQTELTDFLSQYLETRLAVENAIILSNFANRYDIKNLVEKCLKVISENIIKVLLDESFNMRLLEPFKTTLQQTLSSKEHYRNLTVNKVLPLLNIAGCYELDAVVENCLTFIDKNAEAVLKHDSFNKLTKNMVEKIFDRNTLGTNEINIFNALQKWSKRNPKADIQSLIALIRPSLLQEKELYDIVRPSRLLDDSKILDAVRDRFYSINLPYRAIIADLADFKDNALGADIVLSQVYLINHIEFENVYENLYKVLISKDKNEWLQIHPSSVKDRIYHFNFSDRLIQFIRMKPVGYGSVEARNFKAMLIDRSNTNCIAQCQCLKNPR